MTFVICADSIQIQRCETFIVRAYEQLIGQCAEIIDETDSMRIPHRDAREGKRPPKEIR